MTLINHTKGVVITCDIRMAQLIISINDSMPNAYKFILYILDDTHIFVQPNSAPLLTKKIQEFKDQNYKMIPKFKNQNHKKRKGL
jgi:TFIIH basal transcription factor complex TTD-A subunit